MLAFGAYLYEFRNMTQSMFSLLRMILGDFDFESMRVVNPTLGPIIFSIFIVLVSRSYCIVENEMLIKEANMGIDWGNMGIDRTCEQL